MGKWTWENIGGQEDTHSSSPISSIQVSHLLFVYFPSKSSTEKTKTKPKTKKKKKREVQRNLPIITMRLTSLKADRQTLAGRTARPGWREKKQTNKRRGRKIMSPPRWSMFRSAAIRIAIMVTAQRIWVGGGKKKTKKRPRPMNYFICPFWKLCVDIFASWMLILRSGLMTTHAWRHFLPFLSLSPVFLSIA